MTKMLMEMQAMPAVIAASAEAVLKQRGIVVPVGTTREIGNNATAALASVDELFGREGNEDEPSTAELLAVGDTLCALAAVGRSATPEILARVGKWLKDFALDELDEINDGKAA